MVAVRSPLVSKVFRMAGDPPTDFQVVQLDNNAFALAIVGPNGELGEPNPATAALLSALRDRTLVGVAGARVLAGWDIQNPNNTDAYLQVFDAATTGAVTLGTTVPQLSLWVPALGARDAELANGVGLSAGLVVAATTTPTGLTLVTTGLVVNLLYR